MEADSQSQLGQLGGWQAREFEPVLQRQKRQASPCNELPCELLSQIFHFLNFHDKIRAQRCCRRWNALLRRPQEPGLWGFVKVDLKDAIARLSRQGGKDARLLTSARTFFQPLCRWIRKRRFGLSTLHLVTSRCSTCEVPNQLCPLHACKNCSDAINGGVVMIMGCLQGHTLDVNLTLESCAPGKPMGILELGTEPAMQQVFAEHVCSLWLMKDKVDEEQLLGICALTKLTSLSLNLGEVDLGDHSDAVLAIASLQRLHTLTLMGHREHNTTVAHLDLSSLTQLTALSFHSLKGGFTAAATATGLRQLEVDAARDRASHQALEAMQALTALEKIAYKRSSLRVDMLEMMGHLPSLQNLIFFSVQCGTPLMFESLVRSPSEWWQALGQVTTLTSLTLKTFRCPEFSSSHLSGLASLSHFCAKDMDFTTIDLPGTWDKLRVLELNENCLTELPTNLELLTSLRGLMLDNQKGDMQITRPMSFVSELQSLRQVHLRRADNRSAWNSISMFFLMQAQMLIEETPGCHVIILD